MSGIRETEALKWLSAKSCIMETGLSSVPVCGYLEFDDATRDYLEEIGSTSSGDKECVYERYASGNTIYYWKINSPTFLLPKHRASLKKTDYTVLFANGDKYELEITKDGKRKSLFTNSQTKRVSNFNFASTETKVTLSRTKKTLAESSKPNLSYGHTEQSGNVQLSENIERPSAAAMEERRLYFYDKLKKSVFVPTTEKIEIPGIRPKTF